MLVSIQGWCTKFGDRATWVINQDASEIDIRQSIAKKYKVSLHVLQRECPPEFEEISTSNIIKKIRDLQ